MVIKEFFPPIGETTWEVWVKSQIVQYVIYTETSSFLADLQNSVVGFTKYNVQN